MTGFGCYFLLFDFGFCLIHGVGCLQNSPWEGVVAVKNDSFWVTFEGVSAPGFEVFGVSGTTCFPHDCPASEDSKRL